MGKRVFLSDIHISEGRSLNQDITKQFDWLTEEDRYCLSGFLYRLTIDSSIDEVIFLGDLFDTWVVPIEQLPMTYRGIFESSCNKALLDAIAKLSSEKRTVYIRGNHDMTAWDNKDVIMNRFPNLHMPDESEYNSGDGIIAAHGHEYFIFNAENVVPKVKLPLGYYLSRLAATLSASGRSNYISMDIVPSVLHSIGACIFHEPRYIVRDSIDYLVRQVRPNLDDTFRISIDSGSISIGEVKELYADMFSDWENRESQNFIAAVNFQLSNGSLNPTKCRDIIKCGNCEVVIFGHTHNKCNDYAPDMTPIGSGDRRILGISANTGTWCGSRLGIPKPRTFIITELINGVQTVQLSDWCSLENQLELPHQTNLSTEVG